MGTDDSREKRTMEKTTPDQQKHQHNLSEETLYYGYLGELMVNELSELNSSLVSKLTSYKTQTNHDKMISHFRRSRGKLQNFLGREFLREEDFEKIRSFSKKLASADEKKDLSEDHDLIIHELKGLKQRRLRKALVYGLIAVAMLLLSRSLFPQKENAYFEPVEALSYETKVLEDQLVERLDLQTSEISDVREYFLNYSKLSWEDSTLKLPKFWKLIGASVLDYEMVKISLVAYTRPLSGKDILEVEKEVVSSDGQEIRIEVMQKKVPRQDFLVYYSFDSKENYLPAMKPSVHKGVEYYTYESEDYNIILWRTRGRYHLIFGRIIPTEMASYIP